MNKDSIVGNGACCGLACLNESGYGRIFDLAPDLMCVADPDGICLAVNPAGSRILGFSQEEMVGKSWEDFIHPDDIERTRCEVARQLAGHEVLNFVNRYRTGDRGYIFLQWQATFLEDGILIGTARDISVRKRQEKLLAKVVDNERRKVCAALHDGVGQQLVGLRMLLSKLGSELAKMQPELASRAEQIKQIADETLSAVRHVMDGLIPVDEAPDALMKALAGMANRAWTLHGVRCTFECSVPVLIADNDLANQLFLIAQESVMNAIRHAAPRHITISLFQRKGILSLVISDDGRGLPLTENTMGLGLEIMCNRAALIGASLDVAAGETCGTMVTCCRRMDAL